ncbi:hypothetical protein A8C56_02945 [Niabella ginsenosidivorans]|uniref:SHOCT domain-containing protein n=1 Tax=Niabella ginsenosidivorans TaxID=1176587 RepID=A0A1A9HXD7_9BACT|nr:SHOCT domain-containing protein [Niabella ginsenosidivorans]ANH80078.1 hypothetical protein A8C56_02945 [Niabella ginsenosidivorans]
MKKTLIILVLLPTIIFAQKNYKKGMDSLITTSGWVIHKGDTITLGAGSRPTGDFAFIAPLSLSVADVLMSKPADAMSKLFSGSKFIVSIIGGDRIVISGGKKDRIKAFVMVEPAIQKGEIVIPYKNKDQSPLTLSKADELTKLKKLLDDGVLTKEEFEAEKRKILDKN